MTGWVVETLVASTFLMVAVLILRRPVAQIFGPRIAYGLWLLPALRMILPPLPAGVAETAPITPLPLAMQSVLPLVQLPRPAVPAPADWSTPLAMIWLAGALCFFGLSLFAYVRFVRRIGATSQPVTMVEGIKVCASDAVEGPLAYGVFGPAVALPANYAARYAPAELDLALRHELMHHRRRDVAVNLIALALRSIHWFNPIAYVAYRAFRADQELACDAAVLAGDYDGERHIYGCALVKSAGGHLPAAACAMNGKGQLKRRLTMINRMRNSPARALAGGATVIALLGVGLGLTASGGIAAEKVSGVRHQALSVIAPPPPVPAVPRVWTARTVLQVPDVPSNAAAPQPPVPPTPPSAVEPPEAPEPPDMAEIDASVQVAMADAERAVGEAEKAIGEAEVQAGDCDARSRNGPCSRVDMAQIRRDVLNSLREARNDLGDKDGPDNAYARQARARVRASFDAAIARFERDPRWQ
jgi:bla regulator protein blaR1